MDVFGRLAPFIQDFIYQNQWEELRGIQVAACEVVFETDDNLLLSSGTASGKTCRSSAQTPGLGAPPPSANQGERPD